MTRQSTVDKICDNVQKAFNPPQIRFLKILRYPASAGMRIGFDYRSGTKIITFSKRYLDEHHENHLTSFLNDNTLSTLRKKGDQHIQVD